MVAIMTGRAWAQECEVPGLTAPTVRKQTQDEKWDPALSQTQRPTSSSKAPVPKGSTAKQSYQRRAKCLYIQPIGAVSHPNHNRIGFSFLNNWSLKRAT